MKKSILVISALFLATSSAAVLCACGGGEKGVTEVAFASYESWQDGFYNINMMDGFGRITRSDEQAHGGSYSAKLQPLGSVTDPSAPYFYYPMQMEGEEGYHYADFSKLEKVSFFMYNAEAEEREVQLAIVASISDVYSTDYKVVGTYSLAPGTWTEIEYQPDYEALQNLCDITNVAGLGFVFENQNSSSVADAPVLYLDDLTLSVSDEPLAEIRTSEPARGEVQSFDLASSLVYVRLESGVDYGETYLAAGSDKLPEGVKGGVEFAVTDAEMGTWPRLRFDSRTPQEELVGADRFSIQLYFGTEDETVKQVELHMFPDTSSEYVEYVPTNEWVKLTFESETVFNNWGDSIGVKALGLFWLQNGGSGCFNAIDTVRVADIRAEFDEVRVPELPEGQKGQTYSIPEASLEVDGTPVAAEKWSYSVSYRDKELYEDKFGPVEVSGNTFTPQTGGVYLIAYQAEYGGKTYEVTAEVSIARDKAAQGEIESFDDPASLDGILMNSGTGVEYTNPEYLWEGDDRLDGASEGTKGGVEYTIDPVYGTDFDGSWPRFYLNSRITANEIARYDTVAFDLYLDAPSHDKDILVKMYPETDEFDKYVSPNTWVTVRLDAEQFADYLTRVSPGSRGFFWVQNGDPANVIEHIRIANIRALDLNDQRPAVGETEVECFGDELSLDNLTITGVSSVSWNAEEKAAVASVDPAVDVWMDVSVRARQDISVYEKLKEEGYNAVTLELFLKPAEGSNARNAQMQYWASQNEYAPSQASVAIGEWVTLTFDLDTYLEALSSGRTVKLFWVASYNRSENTIAKLSEVHIRNVQVAKVDDAVAFGTGAEDFFLLDSPENPASNAYFEAGSSEIPSGVPEAVKDNGAVRLSLGKGAESWPHIKFSADRNLFEGGNTVTVTLYVKSTSSSPLSIRQWPHGGDWIVKGELPVNQWVEFKVDAEVLRSVYNWAPSDGIEYTDLLWFTNAGGRLVSEVWIAGLRVSEEEPVSFEESGIGMENATADQYEAGETGLDAWFGIASKKGYAYKLTIKHGETVLVKGTDYTVSDQDASVTLLNCEAGEYTFVFESYGDRFERGEYTVTVRAKEYTVSIGSGSRGMVGTAYKLPGASLRGAASGVPIEWTYAVSKDGESYPVTDGKFTPDTDGEYTLTYTALYRGREYVGTRSIFVDAYRVVIDGEDVAGTVGESFTLPDAHLVHYTGSSVEADVEWTYSLDLGETNSPIWGNSFTPGEAGLYTVTYTAEYEGKTYSKQLYVTIYRMAPAKDEVESFNDPSSLSNVQISDTQSVSWSATDGVVAKIDQNEGGNWVNVTLTARQSRSTYERLLAEGYNAVTLELYLTPMTKSGNAVRINYWAEQTESNFGYLAVGKWVTVTLDLNTYLELMGSDGSVKLFWVESTGENRISEMCVRNVKVVKTEDVVAFGTGAEGFFLLDSAENPASNTYFEAGSTEIPSGVPASVQSNGAVRLSLSAGRESWPHVKFGADRKMFEGGNTVTVTLYVKSTSSGLLSIRQWPHGGDWIVKGELPVNQWVEFQVDAEVLRSVYGWGIANGIDYTDLFWFENTGGNTVSEVWIAGLRVSEEEPVAFEDSGIAMDNTSGEQFEAGETGFNAWFGITSKNGFAYKLTIRRGETVLVKGTDYTVSDQDASVTLIGAQAGEYIFSFESYGGRFESGSVTVTVTEKQYSVSPGTLPGGTVGVPYAIPAATLEGASDSSAVVWTYSVTCEGEAVPVTDGSFTPDREGAYTVTYTASYRGRTFTASAEVKVGSFRVDLPASLDKTGTAGVEYELPDEVLLDGAGTTVSDGVVWTIEVTLGENTYPVTGGKFTPDRAGEYTVTYTAAYNGSEYSASVTLTVERAAAEANEIESFNDPVSLDSVRLESGDNFAETYLPAGSDLLPADAKGGVSFAIDDRVGGSWPNLHFSSFRMTADAIKGYDTVVIPMYIGVKEGSNVEKLQISVNGKNVYVKPNTWFDLVLDADFIAGLASDGSIFWIQNGDASGVFNQINEVRIASVYAKENDPAVVDMSTTTSFPEGNLWTDASLAKDDDTFKNYYDKSLAPDGMPLDMDRAFRFYFNGTTNDGSMELWTTATQQQMTDWLAEGYTKVDVAFYFGVSDASETFQVTVFSGNAEEKYDVQLSVNEWATISLDLETFKDCVWWNEGNSQWQIKLFYLYGGTSAVTDIWMTGFTLSK